MRNCRVSPIHEGMEPSKWFSPRSSINKRLHELREAGKTPDSLFLLKCKEKIEVRDPMLDGISPSRLLFEKSSLAILELCF